MNTVFDHDIFENYIGATGLGLTKLELEYTYEDHYDLMMANFDNGIGIAYDISLEGHTAGNEITYQFALDSSVKQQNLAVYHVDANDTLNAVDFELVEEDGITLIEFKSTETGTFVYGTEKVPSGYTFTDLVVTNNGANDYFVGDDFELYKVDVKAVYTNASGETFQRVLYEYDEGYTDDGYTWSFVDMTTAGSQEVKFTYNGVTKSFFIKVWDKELNSNNITVSTGEGEFGLTGVTVKDSANENVGTAVQNLLKGEYKAYDISLVFADGYSANDSEKTVTLPIPAGVTNPAVFYVSDDGKAEEMPVVDKDETTVTFTTTHFSTYAVGDRAITEPDQPSGDWVTITAPSGSTTTYEYTLDTDGINANGNYLIVNTSTAGNGHALTNNGVNSAGDTVVSIETKDGKKIIKVTDNSKINWIFSNSTQGTVSNSTRYVYLSSSDTLSTSSRTLYFNNQQNGAYRIYKTNSTQYLRYNNGWGRTDTATNVYLYALTGTSSTGGTGGLYGNVSGTFEHKVPVGTSREEALAIVKSGIAVFYHEGNASNAQKYEDDGAGMSWTLDSAYNGVTPGEFNVTISYNGTKLGTAKVIVEEKQIAENGVELNEFTGSVPRNSDGERTTGATLTVTFQDGSKAIVDVTVSMLSGDMNLKTNGTYPDLTVTYGKYKFENAFTLTVTNVDGNNYPEYPHEGAVKVNKTGTGIDFQSSGIAQIEISASGVPLKKGADLIIMLDTSSSTYKNSVDGKKNDNASNTNRIANSRLDVLEESLTNLLKQLRTPVNGEIQDIRVAIADFNGYYDGGTNSPYDQLEADYIGSASYDQDYESVVYTHPNATKAANGIYNPNTGKLDDNAFINVSSLPVIEEGQLYYKLNATSGTNYDYGFDAIYQLGTIARKTATSERDLYVIFMSDGATFQWNYYHSRNSVGDNWEKWITGGYQTVNAVKNVTNSDNHTYYYDMVDHDGDGELNEHRMANAIKGSQDDTFQIVRKSRYSDSGYMDGVMKSIDRTAVKGHTDIAQNAYSNDIYEVPGLGAKMFTINFASATDGSTDVEAIDKSLMSTASDQTGSVQYYYKVHTAEELNNAFNAIGAEVAYAASNARFVDKMGPNYNLQLETATYKVVNADNSVTTKTFAPVIEILSYDIYTKSEADASTTDSITDDMIGVRKGTSSLLEAVKFSNDGKKAYSSLIDVDKDGVFGVTVTKGSNGENVYTISDTDDNIFGTDEIIYAKTFIYNASYKEATVSGIDIPTGTNEDGTTSGSKSTIPGETFYWKLGTVQSTELAMKYYVYLDGSMEGQRPAGSYETNEFAILYYDNYLGNSAYKPTVSPTMGWKAANVSYAFYLVNSSGQVVVNQSTGATGSFANKVAVTTPVVYKEIMLNNIVTTEVLDVQAIADDVLPKYYELYDNAATYAVTINSNGTGGWDITKGAGKANTTYVTNYGGDQFTNKESEYTVGLDYTHTVVWFAVLWEPQAHPDTVVIDYGLPVDIDVLTNDMFGVHGSLVGIKSAENLNLEGYDETLAAGFGDNYTGTYGTAKANKALGKVTYTPNTTAMNGYDQFGYAVYFADPEEEVEGYYYDTITVIPATTIYYEDSFLSYTASNTEWKDEGTAINGAKQDEDRPGKYSLTDANNIYGFDHVNENMSTFSLGTAKKVLVDSDSFARANFSFYGTGFDVIGMTSNTTGTLAVMVKAAENIVVDGNTVHNKDAVVKAVIVDTYYGYTYDESTNTWTPTPDDNVNNSIYQVPVMQVESLPYGKYNVEITATYGKGYDHTTATEEGYWLYLDAVRIYDPANDGLSDGATDTTIEDAYKMDGEAWPTYKELRDQILAANSFDDVAGNILKETQVDFDEAIQRSRMYHGFERHRHEESCNLFKGVN